MPSRGQSEKTQTPLEPVARDSREGGRGGWGFATDIPLPEVYLK